MKRWLLLAALVLKGCGGGMMLLYAQTTPIVVATTVSCATSVDGSVVGVPNPLYPPIVSVGYSGTLGSGNYFVQIAWYDAAGHLTLVGPEVQIQLAATGQIQVNLPASGQPANSVGMKVYIGTTSGGETLQGATTGAGTFTQSTPLTTGAAEPSTNTTVCQIVANDAGWPTGTGYQVSMTTPGGDTVPGYPQQWQLLGPGQTINLGMGIPLYNGTVTYGSTIQARPYNHGAQSISGPLSMTGYSITQVSALGVGTSVPAWPIDVENGAVNTTGGYIYAGGQGVTTGQCLVAGSDAYKTFVPGSCLPSALYYQTVSEAGTSLPQQTTLNFDGTVVASNSTSPARTNVGLPAVGTAGTYANPLSITTDAYGRVTAATAGSAVSRVCNTNGCYRISADGTIEQWGTATGCATTDNASCFVTVTFPYSFTTTTNLSILASTVESSTTQCVASVANPATGGFTFGYSSVIYVGGAGTHCPGTQSGDWYAIGH